MKRSSALLVATTMMLSPVPGSAELAPRNCENPSTLAPAAVDSVAWAPPSTGVSPRLTITSRYGQAAVNTNFPVHELGWNHACLHAFRSLRSFGSDMPHGADAALLAGSTVCTSLHYTALRSHAQGRQYMTTRRAACLQLRQLSITTEGEPARIAMCHCLECQRRTGAVIIRRASLAARVTIAGKSISWNRKAESGNALTFYFCPVCGSTVYWEGQGFPGMIGVAIGAFADLTFPPPTISVWEETRHPWVELQLAVPATRVPKQAVRLRRSRYRRATSAVGTGLKTSAAQQLRQLSGGIEACQARRRHSRY